MAAATAAACSPVRLLCLVLLNHPMCRCAPTSFRGQNITSQQSHKSYRPITVLMFRWTRQAWSFLKVLVPGLDKLIPSSPPLILDNKQQRQDLENFEPLGKPAKPPGGTNQQHVAGSAVVLGSMCQGEGPLARHTLPQC